MPYFPNENKIDSVDLNPEQQIYTKNPKVSAKVSLLYKPMVVFEKQPHKTVALINPKIKRLTRVHTKLLKRQRRPTPKKKSLFQVAPDDSNVSGLSSEPEPGTSKQ